MKTGSDTRRLCVAGLLLAMLISAAWVLHAGRFGTFYTDEIYYYARFVAHGLQPIPTDGIEYFLAPHNSHFVPIGKLIYRAMLEVFGTSYAPYRVLEVLTVLACVGLFFVLVARRVGPVAALIGSVSLLFLGFAYETFLWAFNLHTTIALALGLAAVLALEREDRTGDRLCCLALVLATATVELGLAFAAGVAVTVMLREDRWRRSWIFLVPVAIYAVWWLWARQFDQSETDLLNIHLIPADLLDSVAAIWGSLLGLNPTGPEASPWVTELTAWGTVAAAVWLGLLGWRLLRGRVPVTLWTFLVTALVYWVMIALGGRPPDSSRYMFVGAVLVLLMSADALRGVRIPGKALAGGAIVVLLAIAPNVSKFYDGRRLFINDAAATQTEYAMLDLSRDRVSPGYIPAADPAVNELGGGVGAPLAAGEYFRAASEFGSLSYSLDEVRAETQQMRTVADMTLIRANEIGLEPTSAPPDPGACEALSGSPDAPVYVELEAGEEALIGATGEEALEVRLARFAPDGVGLTTGTIEPGGWARLALPPDVAPDLWRVIVDGPGRRCPG